MGITQREIRERATYFLGGEKHPKIKLSMISRIIQKPYFKKVSHAKASTVPFKV